MFQFLFLFFFFSLLSSSVRAASADDWRSRSIYQVVTDRFALSDNSSSEACDTAAKKYCGGSWQGITNQLDYIQSMGFDAVWISPVTANIEGNTTGGEAYHGYWTQNLQQLNSHFGSADDLKNLSDAIHARGMYLMVDVVVNHVATPGANLSALNFTSYKPFSRTSEYHTPCFVLDYTNQTEVEQCWLGTNEFPLADINTDDSQVVDMLYKWVGKLVKDYGVDGLRVGAVKNIQQGFWSGFSNAAGVFTLGEVVSDNTSYVADYTQVIDAVLDYPTWFNLTDAFSSTTGNLSALPERVTGIQKEWKAGAFLTGSFLENHDQPRFQSRTKDTALVKNAMTWPFIYDGIPIMYYGQEQGFSGGGDPNNREAMWPSGYYRQTPLVSHVRALNAARKAAARANKFYHTTQMKFIPQTSSAALAISRPPLLTLLTNSGSNGETTWNVTGEDGTGFKANETLVDVLTCKQTQADANGGVVAHAAYGEPQVLMPADDLSMMGKLCPSAATGNFHSNGGSSTRNPGSIVGFLCVALALALVVI
ncbi:glycoside hydrolase family 13 protein [Plicaturopsis crispa FD-325 SS-3]|nr:glycoside hydrolase family 13 protein [Plicaturopsis crispa FD-325 SS-3]